METKYEKAINVLMWHFGYVWYNNEWIPEDEAHWKRHIGKGTSLNPHQDR